MDTSGVEQLVSTLMLNKLILEDLIRFNEACRDPVSTCNGQSDFLSLFFSFPFSYDIVPVQIQFLSFLGP
jgi:hypothetical protein